MRGGGNAVVRIRGGEILHGSFLYGALGRALVADISSFAWKRAMAVHHIPVAEKPVELSKRRLHGAVPMGCKKVTG